MEIIDFDSKFQYFIKQWVKDNVQKCDDMESLEDNIPDLYYRWISTPKDWLDNISPKQYFERISSPDVLIKMLREYFNRNYNIPDLLLDRIVDVGSGCLDQLIQIMMNISCNEKLRITAVKLLIEIDSQNPLKYYIDLIKQQKGQGELANLAAMALINLGDIVKRPVLEALKSTVHPYEKLVYLDILSNFKGDDEIYKLLISAFMGSSEHKAIYASYLARYGNSDALDVLEKAIKEPDLTYLEYLKIKNAIEQLGGIIEIDRDFSGDETYQQLKNLVLD